MSAVEKLVVTREMVLHLYRGIMKSARGMPNEQRKKWVQNKCRFEFRKHAQEKDIDSIKLAYRVGLAGLDSVDAQVQNFKDIHKLLDPEDIRKEERDSQRNVDIF